MTRTNRQAMGPIISKDAGNGTTSADGQDKSPEPAETPALPREAQDQIGLKLRQIYGQLLSDPLPDKFTKLLDKLSKAEE